MAEISIPIQVNLPDDWVEQIVDRLKNDQDAEWVQIIRCNKCLNWERDWQPSNTDENVHYCAMIDGYERENFYCGFAERMEVDNEQR